VKSQKTDLHFLQYLLVGLLLLTAEIGQSQKPFYADSEKEWNQRKTPKTPPVYSVFLIGDAGEPDFTKPSALKILEGHLKYADSNSIVVFLGDNIYPAGLPDSSAKDRDGAEGKINAQLDILKSFKGKVVFVPGNHDWDHWSQEGIEAIKREEAYIETYLNRGNTFLPDEGCPGPAVLELTDKLVLVSIDTQWWLHEWDKNEKCAAPEDSSFIAELDSVLYAHRGKQIIAVAHHPILTNGNQGGYFSWKDHLFPLTAKYHNLYIPLPILGSIYPVSRKMARHIQDSNNPRYQSMRTALNTVFSKHPNLIFAAGHEHNLQYFSSDNVHYIVSGSGSKTTYAAKKHGASFTYQRQGFMKLSYYANGEMLLEAWVTNEEIDEKGRVVYIRQLVEPVTP